MPHPDSASPLAQHLIEVQQLRITVPSIFVLTHTYFLRFHPANIAEHLIHRFHRIFNDCVQQLKHDLRAQNRGLL